MGLAKFDRGHGATWRDRRPQTGHDPSSEPLLDREFRYWPLEIDGAVIWTGSPKSERVVVELSTARPRQDASEVVIVWVACVRTIRPSPSSHTDSTNGVVRKYSLYGLFSEFVRATVLVVRGIGTKYFVAG